MKVVEIDAVERNAELRKGVERGLLGPPVKFVAPVFRELLKWGAARIIETLG
jgi:hypothetical protein